LWLLRHLLTDIKQIMMQAQQNDVVKWS
jgi:hypothetical protein